ncbi:MAG: DUF1223 domain-containing protein [Alphaproteobacteria bacterium]|nr:DUF1223 domain-containing protein [Alphaproteobacteria bacterium]
MHRIRTALFFALAVLLPGPHANAQESQQKTARAPLVVELYTSHGCSSCPPADAIMEKLAARQDIIALSCPVSYWDGPWSANSSLSRDFCDVRQHGYADSLQTHDVYTPQMVVNGETQFIGSRANELENALKKESPRAPLPIKLETKEDGIIRVTLPTLPVDGYLTYRLWGFGYKKNWTESVSGGENNGHTITYANAARTYHNMGGWMGEETIMDLKKPDEPIDGLVIFAQANGYGQIVAAGKIEF